MAWCKDEIVPGERHLVLVSSRKALAQLAEVQLTELTEGVRLQIKKPRQAPKHINKSTQALKSRNKGAKLLLVSQSGTEPGLTELFRGLNCPLLARLVIIGIIHQYL